jgi:hypothetical protein
MTDDPASQGPDGQRRGDEARRAAAVDDLRKALDHPDGLPPAGSRANAKDGAVATLDTVKGGLEEIREIFWKAGLPEAHPQRTGRAGQRGDVGMSQGWADLLSPQQQDAARAAARLIEDQGMTSGDAPVRLTAGRDRRQISNPPTR